MKILCQKNKKIVNWLYKVKVLDGCKKPLLNPAGSRKSVILIL